MDLLSPNFFDDMIMDAIDDSMDDYGDYGILGDADDLLDEINLSDILEGNETPIKLEPSDFLFDNFEPESPQEDVKPMVPLWDGDMADYFPPISSAPVINEDIMWNKPLIDSMQCIDPSLCIPPNTNESQVLNSSCTSENITSDYTSVLRVSDNSTPSLATTEERDDITTDNESEEESDTGIGRLVSPFEVHSNSPVHRIHSYMSDHSYTLISSEKDYLGVPTPSPSEQNSIGYSSADEEIDVVNGTLTELIPDTPLETTGVMNHRGTVVVKFKNKYEIENTPRIFRVAQQQLQSVLSKPKTIVPQPATRGRPAKNKNKNVVIPSILYTPRQQVLRKNHRISSRDDDQEYEPKPTHRRVSVLTPQNRRRAHEHHDGAGSSSNNNSKRLYRRISDSGISKAQRRSQSRKIHNHMERARRIHQRDMLTLLRDKLPALADDERASKCKIIEEAYSYINYLKSSQSDLGIELERWREKVQRNEKRLASLKCLAASEGIQIQV